MRVNCTAENQDERLFSTRQHPILVSCTLKTWKFLYFRNETCYRNGNLCKDFFLFVFNLVLIRIHKTSLFWLNNLMKSLWKPSILILQKVVTFSQQVKGGTCFPLVCACFATSGSCVDCYEPQNAPTQGHLNCITKKIIYIIMC